nr:reverse transcriptase domain-containing protein [Tanacetum cinerariifolium]
MELQVVAGNQELKVVEPTTKKSSIDEPPVVELKDLRPHLEYAFLEGDDKLPVIIAKDLQDEEKTALMKVLKSHKQALAWQLSDIKGIAPESCVMEDDFKPAVQHQRRANPKLHEVIKKKVLKLLDARLIYPISDSLWEKSHFMVKEGIVLGHKISKNGIKIKSSDGVFTARKPLKFLKLATMDPPGDMTARTTPPERCLTLVWTPRAIISDRGTHFCNDQFAKVMLKYGVTHRLATAYHPQTSGQVKVSSRGLQRILERTVGENRASWLDKIDDTL